jgi:tetratricopeptide (TPR) repeat protein
MPPSQHPEPEPEAIREALDRILGSRLFARAGRVAWILRRIVDLSLAGKAAEISEKTLAADLSGDSLALPASRTSVIRTTILRLRQRLEAYYRSEGREEDVRIDVPKGSYEPSFSLREQSDQTRSVPVPVLPRLSENVDARKLYLEGRLYLQRQAGPEIRRALGYFQRAFQLDPSFAAALAGMSDCCFLLALMNMMPGTEALREAAPLLDQAVRLDPECGDAWASMGVIQGVLGWRWKQAEHSFQRAIELSPGVAGVLLKYSSFNLLVHRRFDESRSTIREALERQPNSPRISLHYVVAACCRGDYEEARTHGLRTLEMAPRFEPLHMWLGRTYCALGEYEQALAHFRTASRLKYSRHLMGYEGYCYARLGRDSHARRVLDKLSHWKGPGLIPDYIFATLYLGLGEIDNCLGHMERAVELRCPWMPLLLSVDPLFNEVRQTPRAIALMEKMKLPHAG